MPRLYRHARALLVSLLDILFPPRARELAVRTRVLEELPISPHTQSINGVHITTLMPYKSEAAQSLIRALKYDGSRAAARLSAEALHDFLTEELADIETFDERRVICTPVPLAPARHKERGFNQTVLILEELVQFHTLPVELQLLTRTRETKPQTRLPRAERLRNVKSAFALTQARDLRGVHVILLDDVTTTGATLAAAAAPLRKAGARVSAVAIARA